MVKLESGGRADRDRRVPRRPRHRGVRAPGPQAAVGAQDRRLSRAGARARGRARMLEEARRWRRPARTCVLLECIPAALGTRRSPQALHGAGHRHRRRSRHRRADPGALRHARHHHRAQAALRAQFHGRQRARSRRVAALRAGGQVGRVSRRPSTASDSRSRDGHGHHRSRRCARACAPGAAPGCASLSCRRWAICTPAT